MAQFRYESLAGGGGAQVIEAVDRASAVRELLERGVTPTKVEEIGEGFDWAGGASGFGLKRVMSRTDSGMSSRSKLGNSSSFEAAEKRSEESLAASSSARSSTSSPFVRSSF